MDKLIMIIFAFFLFASCNNANADVNSASNKEAKAKQVNQTSRDTVPATKSKVNYKPRTNNSNYIVSTSRQKSEIKQSFPYDIDLRKADGTVFNSSEVFEKGKPTVFLFWLTTCYPCKIEMNAIQAKFSKWKEETDFNLVAISTDFEKNYGTFQKMVNTKGWQWETYHDFNREFRFVMPGELNGLPQSFILDKNGEIAYHKRKYSSGDEDKLYAKVQELAKM